jgi:glutathione-independent formaldehyde dehydrogenase
MRSKSTNCGDLYKGPGKVEGIFFSKLLNPKAEYGVILRIVATNICASDQHMGPGRTTASIGLVLGREITGRYE